MMEAAAKEFLIELLETPSPSGFERPIQDVVRAYVSDFADRVTTDLHGNVIAAKNPDAPVRVMFAGHCDQIGMLVSHIHDQGFLHAQTIGGWDPQQLIGQRMTVWTAGGPIPAVISRKPIHLLTEEERKQVVKRVVVASSDKAYGETDHLPYKETHPLVGRHPYDVSKSCTDLIAATYQATYQLPITIARCGNIYGGGDLNWSRIVPGTIRSLLKRERPVLRSDGSFVRDYIYVEDAVKAYLALAESVDRPEIAGEAFNFSNESYVTVRQIVGAIAEVMQATDLTPVVLGKVDHEIPSQSLCAEKARTLLSWRPTFSLARGLEHTVAWYRDYLESAA